jgi:hypothetical protein
MKVPGGSCADSGRMRSAVLILVYQQAFSLPDGPQIDDRKGKRGCLTGVAGRIVCMKPVAGMATAVLIAELLAFVFASREDAKVGSYSIHCPEI